MKIRSEHQDRALVVSVSGRIDSGNARDFQSEMDGLLDKGGRGVILDCEQLSYVSSAGLRVLLRVTRHLDQKHVPFVVCSLSPMISEVFQISGFDRIIPVATSRADALDTLPR